MGEIKTNPDGTHTIIGGFSNKRQEDIDLIGNTIFKKPSELESLKETEETKTKETPVSKSKLTKAELLKLNRKQQEKIAKSLGLKGLSKLKELELVNAILKAQQ